MPHIHNQIRNNATYKCLDHVYSSPHPLSVVSDLH